MAHFIWKDSEFNRPSPSSKRDYSTQKPLIPEQSIDTNEVRDVKGKGKGKEREYQNQSREESRNDGIKERESIRAKGKGKQRMGNSPGVEKLEHQFGNPNQQERIFDESSSSSTSSNPTSSNQIHSTHSQILFNINQSLNEFNLDLAFNEFKNLLEFQQWTFESQSQSQSQSSNSYQHAIQSHNLIPENLFKKLILSINQSRNPRFQINLKRLIQLLNFGNSVTNSLRSEISSSTSSETEIDELKSKLRIWNLILLGDETQLVLINYITKCLRKVGENEVLEAVNKVIKMRKERDELEEKGEMEISMRKKLEKERKESSKKRVEKRDQERKLEFEREIDLGFFESSQVSDHFKQSNTSQDSTMYQKQRGEEDIEPSDQDSITLGKEIRNEIKIVESLLAATSKSTPYRHSPLNPDKFKIPTRIEREDRLNSRKSSMKWRESEEEFQERRESALNEMKELDEGRKVLWNLAEDLERQELKSEIEEEEIFEEDPPSEESMDSFSSQIESSTSDSFEGSSEIELKNHKSISDLFSDKSERLPNAQVLFDHLFRNLIHLSNLNSTPISPHALTSFLHISFQSTNFPTFRKILKILKTRNQLNIAHINLLLYSSARVPISKTYDFFQFGNRKKWRGILMCYKELRENQLQEELRILRGEKMRNGTCNKSGLNRESDDEMLFKNDNQFLSHYDVNAKASPLENLLGFPNLPKHLKPDIITYSVMISIFSFKGDLLTSLDIFKDMIETEISFDLPNNVKFVLNPFSTTDNQKTLNLFKNLSEKAHLILNNSKKFHDPNLSIYDSFFRGFAKNSIPSKLIFFDEHDEEKSEWELLFRDQDQAKHSGEFLSSEEFRDQEQEPELSLREEARSKNPWRVQTFLTLFKAFLNLKPINQFSSTDWRDLFLEVLRDEEIEKWKKHEQLESTSDSEDQREGEEREMTDFLPLTFLAFERGNSQLALRDALIEIARMRRQSNQEESSNSSLESQSFSEDSTDLSASIPQSQFERLPFSSQSRFQLLNRFQSYSKSPTSQQFFHLLTALRRVSNDDPVWVLRQWKKVEMKFGLGRDASKRNSAVDDVENEAERVNGKGDEIEEFNGDVMNDQVEEDSEGDNLGNRLVNEEGWHSFKLDNRMKRTLNFLRSKVGRLDGRR